MSALDDVLKGLNKTYGKPVISQADKIIYPKLTRLSTGSLAIDLELGGGVPFGKVTMIVANESAGKTTLAINMIVEAQKLGKRVVFIDVEGTFDKDWAETIGVDLSKLHIAIPDVGEQAVDILDAVVQSNEAGLVILDSIAALMPAAELNKPMIDVDSKGEYESSPEQIGDRALMLNRAVRKLTSALNKINEEGERNQTAVVLINQFR
ncbi:MAG: AAA family ATPase, partial [Chitinophagaceae bacterium]